MRLIWSLIPLVALIGALEDFGDCPPLESPIGTHPETGITLPAGEYDVSSSDGLVLAKPLCYEEEGWLLTDSQLQELRCTYDEITDMWRWNHRREKRDSPIRCSYHSAKPIIQSFTLSNYGGCNDHVERDVFTKWFKSQLESVLPCAQEERCVVEYVTCQRKTGSPEDARLEVKVRPIGLESLDSQVYVMDTAVDFLISLDTTNVDDEGGKLKKREAQKGKMGGLDDLSPDDSETSACDSGQIETSSGGCAACPQGTYANTSDSSNQFCGACPLDEYNDVTSAVQCTACDTGYGTLSIGSESEDECVVVCVVPDIDNAVSPDVDRVEDGDDVTIHCDTGYDYNGATTTIVNCLVDNENNGFQESCDYDDGEDDDGEDDGKDDETDDGTDEETDDGEDDEAECWWSSAYGDCGQSDDGCYRNVVEYCECDDGSYCDDGYSTYTEECYSCWDETSSADQTSISLVLLIVTTAVNVAWFIRW